LTTKRVCVI